MNFLELSNLVLPIIAVLTYVNWRAHKRADQAKSTLRAFYLMEYTLLTIRNPWGWDLDKDTQKEAKDKGINSMYLLIQQRWNDRLPEFQNFLKGYTNFKAEFDNLGEDNFKNILEIINEISIAIDKLVLGSSKDQSNEFLTSEESKRCRNLLFRETEDPTDCKIKKSIRGMEKHCKPYIHMPLRAKYPRLKSFIDFYKWTI